MNNYVSINKYTAMYYNKFNKCFVNFKTNEKTIIMYNLTNEIINKNINYFLKKNTKFFQKIFFDFNNYLKYISAYKQLNIINHPYIQLKKLYKFYLNDDVIYYKNYLIIPFFRLSLIVRDDFITTISVQNIIMGLQKIYFDNSKKFMKYSQPGESVYIIGNNLKTNNFLLCEGWATGITLFNLVVGFKIIVCFSVNNFKKIGQIISKYIGGYIFSVPDNDLKKIRNVGLEAAIYLYVKYGIYFLFLKQFTDGSDINDYYINYGYLCIYQEINIKLKQLINLVNFVKKYK